MQLIAEKFRAMPKITIIMRKLATQKLFAVADCYNSEISVL